MTWMVQGSTDPWQQENLGETTAEQSDQALSATANVPGRARLEPYPVGHGKALALNRSPILESLSQFPPHFLCQP